MEVRIEILMIDNNYLTKFVFYFNENF